MSEIIFRETLLKSFDCLQNQFNQALTDAKTQDAKFEELRRKFQANMVKRLNETRQQLPSNNPMLAQIEGFISLLESTNAEWDKKISARDRGVQFRAGFNDSLLVFVYGKVKSGKSSLGNYIAWGNTDPTDKRKSYIEDTLKPKYFSHDKTDVASGDGYKEAEKRQEFRVGATEATSSIQGFKLPGLTWVDSPGLHSVNEANGKLAKDYVEHADLILYTMKSDAPGRESDLIEIVDLFNKDKKTLLLLTGSDDIDEDWSESKGDIEQVVVMKDAQRCRNQREYVKTALNSVLNISSENVEIISFSARYAQLNADNPNAFRDSGMAQLCQTLHEISQAEGVKIKQKVPMNNFRNFLENCLNDLQPYNNLITNFDAPIIDLKRSIPQQTRNITRDIQDRMRGMVDREFDLLSGKRDDKTQADAALRELKKKLSDEYSQLVSEGLAIIFENIVAGFRNAVVNTYQSSDLIKLPDFKIDTVEDRIPSSVNSGTRKRNSGFLSLLGAGIGFMVGGPLGAAAGSAIGGGVGYASGNDTIVNYRTIQLNVGDNLHEIKQAVVVQLTQSVEKSIEEQSAKLLNFLLDDTRKLVKDLENEISTTEKI